MRTSFMLIVLIFAGGACSLWIGPGAYAQGPASYATAPQWTRAPSSSCTTSSTVITFVSAEAVRTAGLEFASVQSQPRSRAVERTAEVAYNANRYARLSARAAGVIAEVPADLGDRVERGEVLAVVDSIDLGNAKAELLHASAVQVLLQRNAEREAALLSDGVGTKRQVLEAESRLAEGRIALLKARQRLRTLGLSPKQIQTVEEENDTSSLLTIVAPFDGLIVERSAVIGEVVETGKPFLAIADTDVMWAIVDLTEADLSIVRQGQDAILRIDGLAEAEAAGTVTWISTEVDERSRTIKARAEFKNSTGMLRAHMFGRVTIQAGDKQAAVMVPKQSVQWEGCCNVAFVKSDKGGLTFAPARLTLGFDAGDRYEVLAGLSEGQMVVTRGSFILKNQILKDSVGAGCCEVGHLK